MTTSQPASKTCPAFRHKDRRVPFLEVAASTTSVVNLNEDMSDQPKLSKLEFRVMEFLWEANEASIRDITEGLAAADFARRPLAYTTVQTMVYRLEEKGFVRRSGKVGNFHIFAPIVSRGKAQRRVLDDLMSFFGGKGKLVMAHLIETGNLTLDDVKEAENLLKQSRGRRKSV